MKKLNFLLILISYCLIMSNSYAGSVVHPLPGGQVNPNCQIGTTCAGDAPNRHLGVDLGIRSGSNVVSMCDGTVRHNNTQFADIWNSKVILEHNCNGRVLFGIYGHISSSLAVGATVTAGTIIGQVKDWGGNSHLHMGISIYYRDAYWGYTSSTSPESDFKNFVDFRTILATQPDVPYFDGTGSLIDPQGSCGDGCKSDVIKLHPHETQRSAGFFQVYRLAGVCEAVNLSGDLMYADVEVKSWDSYSGNSVYYTLGSLPAAVPLNNTTWNVIAVKTVSPIPQGQTRTVTATCVAQSSMSANVTKKPSGTPTEFNENYFWGGNGSLISHTNNRAANGFGKNKDTVILLKDKKTLSVFQVNTSFCKNVRFTTSATPAAMSLELSWKLWNEKEWQGSTTINSGYRFSFPTTANPWWILKVKAAPTGLTSSTVTAVCE